MNRSSLVAGQQIPNRICCQAKIKMGGRNEFFCVRRAAHTANTRFIQSGFRSFALDLFLSVTKRVGVRCKA